MIETFWKYSKTTILGYELNHEENCILHYKENGEIEYCSPMIDCNICSNVTQIDVIDTKDMNTKLFIEKYALSGQPVLIKNAAKDWKAREFFDLDYFRKIHLDLDSPVLRNENKNCPMLAWNVPEFPNVKVFIFYCKNYIVFTELSRS